MKTKITQYRQGDVLVERVTSIPSTSKPVATENGRIVLAHGEVTGHSHSLDGAVGTLTQESGVTYLEIKTALAMLTHQEHGTVEIPKGKSIRFKPALDKGEPVESIPSLDVDVDGPTATVTDQDGRHRALMAQATVEDLTLVTTDGAIADYAGERFRVLQ